MSYTIVFFIFFFFQAEDGIRDGHVTGVQTCALPIFEAAAAEPPQRHPLQRPPAVGTGEDAVRGPVHHISRARCSSRSEERRVGKECRSRWEREKLNKNN